MTLLPFSSTGKWIDYVYGFVTLKGAEATAEDEAETAEEVAEAAPEILDEVVEAEPEVAEEAEAVEKPSKKVGELEAPEPEAVEPEAEYVEEAAYEPEPEPAPEAKPRRPGFSAKIFDALAGVEGFYGNIVKMDPKLPSEAELEPEPEYAEQEAEPEAIAEEEPVAEIEEDIVEEAVEPSPTGTRAKPQPDAHGSRGTRRRSNLRRRDHRRTTCRGIGRYRRRRTCCHNHQCTGGYLAEQAG